MTEKNMVKADFYTSIILMVLGITATVMALRMPVISNRYSAPGILPMILGIIITVLSFIIFVRSLARSKGRIGISGSSVKNLFADIGVRRIIATTALCLAYALLLGKIWFPLLTFLFVFSFIIFFEYERKEPLKPQIKKVLMAALVALITSVSITLVFEELFFVRLP